MNNWPASSHKLSGHLGDELRKYRELAGWTIADVSSRLLWSESKLSRIETGRSSIRDADLGALLQLYDAPAEEFDRLAALRQRSRRRTWVDGYRDELPATYAEYLRFEALSERIISVEMTVVSGLLQTAEYARAISSVVFGSVDQEEKIDARVSAELARQAVLVRRPPVALQVLIDEAALSRPVGDAGIMHRQMLRLMEVSWHPHVEVVILSSELGAHEGIAGSFSIASHDVSEALVFCPTVHGGALFRDNDVSIFREASTRLIEKSMSPRESRRLIEDCARRYEQGA